MSDQSFQDRARESNAQNLTDRVTDVAGELRQRAGQAFDASSDLAREKLGQFADAAKEVANDAAGRMNETIGAQKSTGADFLSRFADNMRNSARAFEHDTPFAAHGIDLAADYIQDAAAKVRDGSMRDVMETATTFARRQPAAFLGLTVLAGFAAVRFFKVGSDGALSSETRASGSNGGAQS